MTPWALGDSIARGPQGPNRRPVEWVFRRGNKYDPDACSTKRRFCLRVLVIQHGRVIRALATRIHKNTKYFEWLEADPHERMAALPGGVYGQCWVADEMTVWCRGWNGQHVDALRAAAALAAT